MMKKFLERIRGEWISLVFKVRAFLFGSKTNSDDKSSDTRQHLNDKKNIAIENIKSENNSEKINSNTLDGEDDEIYYDALEELKNTTQSENEKSDTSEADDIQLSDQDRTLNIYHSIRGRTDLDCSTYTFALGFEICNFQFVQHDNLKGNVLYADLSSLKLFEIKKTGDGYTLYFKDKNKNYVRFYSECLNTYSPEYFKQHDEKSYSELFFKESESWDQCNIVIPLTVPTAVNVLTGDFSRYNPMNLLKSTVYDQTKQDPVCGMYLKDCKDHVDFCYSHESNHINLSLTSLVVKTAAASCRVSNKTNWPVKDILISRDLVNHISPNQLSKKEEIKTDIECVYIESKEENLNMLKMR